MSSQVSKEPTDLRAEGPDVAKGPVPLPDPPEDAPPESGPRGEPDGGDRGASGLPQGGAMGEPGEGGGTAPCRKCGGPVKVGTLRCPHCGKLLPHGAPVIPARKQTPIPPPLPGPTQSRGPLRVDTPGTPWTTRDHTNPLVGPVQAQGGSRSLPIDDEDVAGLDDRRDDSGGFELADLVSDVLPSPGLVQPQGAPPAPPPPAPRPADDPRDDEDTWVMEPTRPGREGVLDGETVSLDTGGAMDAETVSLSAAGDDLGDAATLVLDPSAGASLDDEATQIISPAGGDVHDAATVVLDPSGPGRDLEDEPTRQMDLAAGAEGPPKLPGEDDPLVGTVVNGQYLVKRRIGAGGMGAVYLAEQLDMKRPVALKVMSTAPGSQSEEERRFRREAQAASKLNHPNIVTVFSFGRLDARTMFMAMEYVDGVSLATVLRQEGSLAPVRALDIAIQVCKGLTEAHSKGVVHRDLKPDNIYLTRRHDEEVVKVLDFGIAKIIDPNEQPADVTRVGLVRGTPIYMSPEQARGAQVDHRSDIYSLGVILHLMLTGSLPIKAETPFAYLHAHQHQKPPGIRRVRPDLDLPPELEAVVLSCLEKRPERRPQSAADLEAALKVIQASLLGVTPDSSWRSLPPIPAYRRRVLGRYLGLAALGAFGVLALFGAWIYLTSPAGTGVEPPAVQEAALAPPPPQDVAPHVVEASAGERPRWVDELPMQVGDERVLVGRSGPVGSADDASGWAMASAMDEFAHIVLDDIEAPGLLLAIRGLVGDRRGELLGRFTMELERALEHGPSSDVGQLMSELRHGQEEVASRMQVLLARIAPELAMPQPEIYWERYELTRAGEVSSFVVAWARRVVPAPAVRAIVEHFGRQWSSIGMLFADPYPLISWGLPDPRGALVYELDPDGPAAKAGLMVGDLVEGIGSASVSGAEDLRRVLETTVSTLQKTGGKVPLSVRRAGKGKLTLTVRIRARRIRRPTRPERLSNSGGGIDE